MIVSGPVILFVSLISLSFSLVLFSVIVLLLSDLIDVFVPISYTVGVFSFGTSTCEWKLINILLII